MKLTLKIKLLPTDQLVELLLDTLKAANTTCNAISDVAWQDKVFNRSHLHHKVYYDGKASFKLSAKQQGKGVAIEDLTHIRGTSKPRNKTFRTKLGKWAFGQLRFFLEYKGQLHGVPVVVVNPRYTSQTCKVSKHLGKRTNRHFKCNNCGNYMDADVNASINKASLGRAVNHVEESNTMCCSIAHIHSGLKPSPSLCVGG